MPDTSATICSEDCFNCPFPDCVLDEITQSTRKELATVEKEIIQPKTLKENRTTAVNRFYRQINADWIKAYKKAWYERNKPALKAKYASYRIEHKEAIRDRQRAWVAANLERLQAKRHAYAMERKEERAAYDKAYREKNGELLRQKKSAYYQANKERIAQQQKERRQLQKSGEKTKCKGSG